MRKQERKEKRRKKEDVSRNKSEGSIENRKRRMGKNKAKRKKRENTRRRREGRIEEERITLNSDKNVVHWCSCLRYWVHELNENQYTIVTLLQISKASLNLSSQ